MVLPENQFSELTLGGKLDIVNHSAFSLIVKL